MTWAERMELATFKRVKLHPDCHVQFEKAYYSAPHRLVGRRLWLWQEKALRSLSQREGWRKARKLSRPLLRMAVKLFS